jgi:hypothetical protein
MNTKTDTVVVKESVRFICENLHSHSLDETGMMSVLHCTGFKADGRLLFGTSISKCL